jgi:lactate permease
MPTLLALLPILLFAALLIGARWSAASAGLAGAMAAAVIAVAGFGHGQDAAGLLPALAGPLAEAAFSALTILWIIFGALAIHEYQSRNGAVGVLGGWLGSFGGDQRLIALFVAWFFALFLEGAAGFGTPLAMAAPLLVGLGFAPLRALLLVLVGHAVGVSFGAVGTPFLPLLAAAAHDPRTLAFAIAALHAVLGGALAAWVYRLAGQPDAFDGVPAQPHGAPTATGHATGGPGGSPGAVPGAARHGYVLVAAAALLFFVPSVALAALTGPELPTLGGALVGVVGFAWVARRRQRRGGGPALAIASDAAPPRLRAVAGATLPYLLVIALILFTRLLPPVRDALRALSIDWSLYGGYAGSVALLYHPGTLLLLGLALATLLRSDGRGHLLPALRRAAARLPMVALALLSVLLMARLMVHAGMIDQLAGSAATHLGSAWLFAAPATGALGSFITGSATASNILFAGFQHATAEAAGLPPLLAAAGQGFGAAIGNIIAPHNIVVGAAAVGIIGAEGQVLRRTLPLCLAYVVAGGVLLLGVHRLG